MKCRPIGMPIGWNHGNGEGRGSKNGSSLDYLFFGEMGWKEGGQRGEVVGMK